MNTVAINKNSWIDSLNIGLMLLSCIVAFVLPFETFLFVYAILGPLHYLTEINWLHQRNYFTKQKNDYLFLLLMGIGITAGAYFAKAYNGDVQEGLEIDRNFLDVYSTHFVYLALASSLAFAFIKGTYNRVIAFMIITLGFFLFQPWDILPEEERTGRHAFFFYFFAVFLPTLIHVFIFTGLFIISGAKKSKSAVGIASVIVFVACALACFFVNNTEHMLVLREYVQTNYADFSAVNTMFMDITGMSNTDLEVQNIITKGKELKLPVAAIQTKIKNYENNLIYESTAGIKVMRFIAFAYTYHYLNWFSKTSIIQWHKTSKPVLATIIIIWITSIGLYIYDYKTGLGWLFFLSFLHVMLEFPLNFKSMADIIGYNSNNKDDSDTKKVQINLKNPSSNKYLSH